MTSDPGKRDLADEARRIFADYLVERCTGEGVEFEELCRRHPEHARELRLLHEGAKPPADSWEDSQGRPPSTLDTPAMRRLAERPSTYGRYQVRDEIARGGMGAILRVHDPDIRRELAMKVLLASKRSRSGSSTTEAAHHLRFLEEAQVTGQLDHPGIVPVHDLGIDPTGKLFFTMKLVKGRTLRQVIDLARREEDGWNRTRVIGILLKVCEAMAYAHDKKVVHRDLKPANVMVGRFGEVYVMDWGLARVLDREDPHDLRLREEEESMIASAVHAEREDLDDDGSPLVTMDGHVVGTPSYMSPEQAQGRHGDVGPRSDVYSVGAMLYHALTGQVPYVYGKGSVRNHLVLLWVCEGPPRPIPELAPDAPLELVAIAEKAMAREPADRYGSMEELAEDLRAYLEGRVVQAFEGGAVAELRKWFARNRALALSATAAVVIAFLGVGGIGYLQAAGRRAAVKSNEDLRGKEAELQAALGAARTAQERALENERVALENERLARERSEELDLALSDLKTQRRVTIPFAIDRLTDAVDDLWPIGEETVPAMEDWLRQRAELEVPLAGVRESLEELRESGVEVPAEGRGGTVWAFVDPTQQAHHEDLLKCLEQAEVLDKLEVRIEERLELARSLSERTIDSYDAQDAWDAAISSIADPEECPAYGGLEIEPQRGLLPLGRDPRSGLWEFWHVVSGDRPLRDPATGELRMESWNGAVLVLLPGGRTLCGSQSASPDAPHYDPGAQAWEAPVQEIELEPFFISKYELTQAQWMRTTGSNPGYYSADARYPVEFVSWADCDRALRWLELELPTEAQWEYAARAGTDTPWFCGAPEELARFANLADRTSKESGAAPPHWPFEPWSDGFIDLAPVGSLEPNAFGLHDMIGNVFEYVRDCFVAYDASHSFAPDGLRAVTSGNRCIRGGGMSRDRAYARSAHRFRISTSYESFDVGVRPVRRLDR